MPSNKPSQSTAQQQPRRGNDPQQQAGATEFQPKPQAEQGDIGEGSYEATRDYQKDIGEYLKKADVEADAAAAKPRSREQAREMEEAEKEGRSHSKGER